MSTRVKVRDLLTPAEVAEMFRVNPKTVTRWAKAGRITTYRTIGGHRRFLRDEIEGMLNAERQPYGPISHGKRS